MKFKLNLFALGAVLIVVGAILEGCETVPTKVPSHQLPKIFINTKAQAQGVEEKLIEEHLKPGRGSLVVFKGGEVERACPGGREYEFPDAYRVILCPKDGNERLFEK